MQLHVKPEAKTTIYWQQLYMRISPQICNYFPVTPQIWEKGTCRKDNYDAMLYLEKEMTRNLIDSMADN